MNNISREEYLSTNPYFKKEDCPFCKENLGDRENIFESKFWLVLKNDYPYFEDYKNHLMAIPKRHIEFTYELSKDELGDYKNIELFMKDFYKAKNYFSFIRQTKGNKSVEHIHYHYLPGMIGPETLNGENYFKIK